MRKRFWAAILLCFFLIPLTACKDQATAARAFRDPTPLVPIAETGAAAYANHHAIIDYSHSEQGYVMVRYLGENDKVRLQIAHGSDDPYTYVLDPGGGYAVFPLSMGDGRYTVNVFENIAGSRYAQVCGATIAVQLADEFAPFLLPNQYVDYRADSKAVSLGAELAAGAYDDLDVVKNVYKYIIGHISYDERRAADVPAGYLPVVDAVLEGGKGICFDYAALTAAMLRSQRIPTRLVIGYSDDVYHAWISVYLKDKGWVNNIIEFKGNEWVRMDPTFDANHALLDRYIGGGSDYHAMYYY